MLGFSIDIPNLAGWGGHYYDKETLSCAWDRLASQSYSIFFPMSSIVIPGILIMICYLRIFLFARESSNKIAQMNKNSSSDFRRSFKIAKGLFVSFMIFLVCWQETFPNFNILLISRLIWCYIIFNFERLPYGVIIMVNFGNRLPRSAVMYSMMLAHLNSAFNSILYGFYNPGFSTGYRRVLKKINDSIYIASFYKGNSIGKTSTAKNTKVFALSTVQSLEKT